MDTESKQLLRELQRSLETFNRQAGTLGRMAQRGANGAQGGNPRTGQTGNTPGQAGDEFEDWWDRRKKDWEESSDSFGKFRDTMNSGAKSVNSSFKLLNKSSNDAAQGFMDLSRKLFGGAIGGVLIGGFTSYTLGLGKTYQEMSEAGTRFSDSLFGMAKAALETGTSIEEYARINKRNSTVAASLATSRTGGLVGLAAQVRKNAEQFGSFGYTVEQLDDLVGDYAETLRLQGRTEDMARSDAQDSFLKVAATADTLASQFGKSRKEIMDTAMAAQRDEVYRAKLAGLNAEQAKQYGDSFGAAIIGLSAQAGEAGKMLSKMLAQTAAFDGRSYNTQAARELFNKVLPEGTTMMQKLYENVSADGDNALKYQNDFVKGLKASIKANRQNLMYLAEGTGAEAEHARRLLDMDANLKEASDDQIRHQLENNRLQKRNQDALTKVTLNLENIWMRLSSDILGKFLPLIQRPMESIAKGLERFSNSPTFSKIEKTFSNLGEGLSKWIDNFMSNERMESFAQWIEKTVTSMTGWVTSLTSDDIDGFFAKLSTAGTVVMTAFELIGKAIGGALWALNKLGENFTTVATVAATVGVALLALKGLSFIAGIKENFQTLFGRNMSIAAKTVHVNGTIAGAGPWGNNGSGANGAGGDNRRRRLGRYAGAAVGIAAVGAGVYALNKSFGVFSGLFQKNQEDDKKNKAAAAEIPEVLDDYTREVLEMKKERGQATEAELAALKKDDDAYAARRARPTGGDTAAETPSEVANLANTPRSTMANIATAMAPALTSALGLTSVAGSAMGMLGRGSAAGGAAGAAGAGAEAVGAGGRVLGFAGKVMKGLGTVMKATPLLGAAVSAATTGMEYLDLKGKRDRGEITEDEFKEGLTKAVTAGIVGAIPGVGLADALSGGIASDALGGAIYNGAIKGPNGTTSAPNAAGATSQPRTPQLANVEERVAAMQIDATKVSEGAQSMDEAMLKQFEEMNNRLLALIQLYKDGTDRLVRAANQTSNNLSNLSS